MWVYVCANVCVWHLLCVHGGCSCTTTSSRSLNAVHSLARAPYTKEKYSMDDFGFKGHNSCQIISSKTRLVGCFCIMNIAVCIKLKWSCFRVSIQVTLDVSFLFPLPPFLSLSLCPSLFLPPYLSLSLSGLNADEWWRLLHSAPFSPVGIWMPDLSGRPSTAHSAIASSAFSAQIDSATGPVEKVS